MEMDISELDPATLPQGEVEFIQILLSNSFPFYNTGYNAEQAIHQLLASQLRHQFDYANVALLRTGSAVRVGVRGSFDSATGTGFQRSGGEYNG